MKPVFKHSFSLIIFILLIIGGCGDRSVFVFDDELDDKYSLDFTVVTPLNNSKVVYPVEIMGRKDVRISELIIEIGDFVTTNILGDGESWSVSITEDAGAFQDTTINLTARALSRNVASKELKFWIISGVDEPWYNYYSTAFDKKGLELKMALHQIIRGHTSFSWSSIADTLRVLDADPTNSDLIVCIYSRHSISNINRNPAEYGVWDRWENEHVWPASKAFPRGTPAEESTGYTDLYNLYACIAQVNGHKSNYDVDNCTQSYADTYNPPFPVPSTLRVRTNPANRGFEPPDEVKGLVARIMFYMVTRYMGTEEDEPKLELTDDIPTLSVSSGYQWWGEFGKLSTFIEWHLEFPPSEYEVWRNNTIYSNYQQNRNPFVDYPHWVTNIWKLE
jgi:endonuclease I